MGASSEKSQAAGNGGGMRMRRDLRGAWFAGAVLVCVTSTILAFTQRPWPDPYKPSDRILAKLRYPIERNAFLRLPVVHGALLDVLALPDGKRVWAVGARGLVIHSDDGGLSWTQKKNVVSRVTVQCRTDADCDDGLYCNGAETCSTLSSKCVPGTLPCGERQTCDEAGQACRDLNAPSSSSSSSSSSVDPSQNAPNEQPILKGQEAGDEARPAQQPRTQPPQLRGPLPDLHAVHFDADGLYGWIVGEYATILATTNGGETWQAKGKGAEGDLYDVQFIDRQNGWASGEAGVFLTVDGGKTWSMGVMDSGEAAADPIALCFVDADNGWAVGENGTILATTNGGKSWKRQNSGTFESLYSIHFVSSTTGWAVGRDGTILGTIDGGQNWYRQASDAREWLRSVHFVDATTGWAVGGNGAILVTADGGRNWSERTSGTTSTLRSVHFVTPTTGWAVGSNGTIVATTNGGQAWVPQTGLPLLRSADFVSATTGWAVGSQGTIWATTNGGRSWSPQPTPASEPLLSVDFVSRTTGWAVGNTILATTDGGQTWRRQYSGTNDWLYSVHFVDETTGWAVRRRPGAILATRDGGETWREQDTGARWLYSVHFVNETTGWAVGRRGTILPTTDGGQTWSPQTSNTNDSLLSVFFVDSTTGWAVGSDGTIITTTDGGQTWTPQTSGTSNWLRSVYFVDSTTGWAVGSGGAMVATKDGGNTWQQQTSNTTKALYDVYFFDANTGRAVGGGFTVLATTDGGKTWESVLAPHGIWPAPWYYLSCLLTLGLVAPCLRRPRPQTAPKATVADVLTTDRPLEAGDPDWLDFTPIALGLSRFLRNENTQPPLTIAVTGEWGTGKSSLMNLLKSDLERHRIRPVWFNAWHHQKEEHLLAALLQNIRAQAIPPACFPQGLRFRVRLFAQRLRRRWLVGLLIVFAFGVSVGALTQVDYRSLELRNPLSVILQAFKESHIAFGAIFDAASRIMMVAGALLGTALAPLAAIWRAVRSFGANPARLMATSAGSTRVRDLEAQSGFRLRFAQEFKEVAKALNPYTMVILIDDLDRCRPKNVLDVLEAVNFLASSGDCFIVLGMARERVMRCIGLGFKGVAEELVDDNVAEAESLSDDERARRRRAEFARQYLEKLINIEVPIPTPSADQSQKLLTQTRQRPQDESGSRVFRFSRTAARIALPSAAVLAVAAAGFFYGGGAGQAREESSTSRSKLATGRTGARQDTMEALREPGEGRTLDEKSGRESAGVDDSFVGELVPAKTGQRPRILGVWVFVLIIPFGLWGLSIRTNVIVRDSPVFKEALRIWHGTVVFRNNTPRAVKRFRNRVRYYAMLQRTTQQLGPLGKRLFSRLTFRRELLETDEQAIPEDILVALTAIDHLDGKWIREDRNWATALLDRADAPFEIGASRQARADQEFKERGVLQAAIKDHLAYSAGHWPPDDTHREKFLKLTEGVRVS